MISVTENSNKFQETRLWNEKSVEDDMVTLGANGTGHTRIHKKKKKIQDEEHQFLHERG